MSYVEPGDTHQGRATGRQAATAKGEQYVFAKTLNEARSEPDFAVILHGDYGGTVYVTCPVARLKCDEPSLVSLLRDIDEIFYPFPAGRQLCYEKAPVGSRIAGGDGGAIIKPLIWCHSYLHEIGITQQVEQVIYGQVEALKLPTVEELKSSEDSRDMYLLWWLFRKTQRDEAIAWCSKAASMGHLGAQCSLTHERSLNPESRVHWLMIVSAREENDYRIRARRLELADAFRTGTGVEVNATAEALLLLQTCNSRCHTRAAARLARLYYDGLGVRQGNVLALMWAILGSSVDRRQPPYWSRIMDRRALKDHLIFMDEVRSKLTAQEITLAEKLANDYFLNKPDWLRLGR